MECHGRANSNLTPKSLGVSTTLCRRQTRRCQEMIMKQSTNTSPHRVCKQWTFPHRRCYNPRRHRWILFRLRMLTPPLAEKCQDTTPIKFPYDLREYLRILFRNSNSIKKSDRSRLVRRQKRRRPLQTTPPNDMPKGGGSQVPWWWCERGQQRRTPWPRPEEEKG